jgi:23S rRNA U2552 (ribose-2'-O)-methylase RlmE/FtsJ
MYPLLAFKLPNNNKISSKILESDNILLTSPCMTHSLFSLGYHHFIERTRDAMNITNKLDSKNEFYFVVNQFEAKINDYADNIENLTKLYINNINENLTLEFYKIWEILFIFDMINSKTQNISCISENSIDLINYIKKFNEKILNKDSKKINFNEIIVIPENEFEFEKNKNNQFLETEKINKKVTVGSYIKDVSKTKNYSDLIIAYGENIYNNKNNKEQESYKLILGELLAILNSQENSGNTIFKIFDTFTIVTLKIIYILSSLYDEVYIFKPFLSRLSETEKFVICKNFKFSPSDKNIKNLISKIEKILKESNSNQFLNDIFLDFTIPIELNSMFKYINTKLVNEQQILINEVVKYIKENNYFGDKYHIHRNTQIESTKWWVSQFYPPSNNIYKNNKENLNKLLTTTLEKNSNEKEKFISNFI